MKAYRNWNDQITATAVGASLLSILLLSGCVVVPVPNVSPDPYQHEVGVFEVGKTTKSEVISILGEPTDTYFGDSEFLFVEPKWNWAAFVAGDAYAGVIADHSEHFILIRFDRQGYFTDFRISEQRLFTGPVDMVTPIAAAFGTRPDRVEFSQKGTSTRVSNSGTVSITDRGILCYGPDFVGFAIWSPANRYVVVWEYQFDEVRNVMGIDLGSVHSVLLDAYNGEQVSFSLSRRSFGMWLTDEVSTRTVRFTITKRVRRQSDSTSAL